MQPVVQPAVQPAASCKHSCSRLYNRLYRVYRHFPGSTTGCTAGCTTGCIVYTGFNTKRYSYIPVQQNNGWSSVAYMHTHALTHTEINDKFINKQPMVVKRSWQNRHTSILHDDL